MSKDAIILTIEGFAEATSRLAAFTQGGAAPMMRGIAGIMKAAVDENFVQQGRPKWAGLKPLVEAQSAPGSAASKTNRVFYRIASQAGRQILRSTGRLANSVVTFSDDTSAMVGTNLVYAGIHNFGGKTKPHVIRPRNVQALKFGNRFAKVVNHPGSKIPRREFLMLTKHDENDIAALVQQYLRGIVL